MLFQIKAVMTGALKFEVDINCRTIDSERVKLGKAVLAAIEKQLDLRGADLQDADLRGADLRGAYLQGAYLQGADLQGADLRDADLRGADLQGAYLQGAYLRGADLQGAYLQGAYLRGADLRGAYLQGAYLQGADLQGADLRDADLQGAYLRGGKIVLKDLLARAIRSDGYGFFAFRKEDGTLHIEAGCQSRSLEEYRQHILDEYPNTDKAQETGDILDFFEKRFAAVSKKETA